MPTKILARDMQLADVVRRVTNSMRPFDDCVVEQIKDGKVHLKRVYAQTYDFSYTGGVIVLFGVEQFTISVDESFSWWLLSRKVLK